MSQSRLVGVRVARLLEQRWKYNPRTKNPYVVAAFQIVGGPFDGQPIRWVKSLTDGTKGARPGSTDGTRQEVEKSYKAMGWDGRGDFTQLGAAQLDRLVVVDIRERTDKETGKVRVGVEFVNPLTAKDDANELSSEERARVFKKFFGGSDGWNANGPDRAGDVPHDPVTGEVYGDAEDMPEDPMDRAIAAAASAATA